MKETGDTGFRRGFTMIEMLVVVAIIGILAGLLLTATQKVRDTARKTRTRHDVNQIATAWTAYLQDYRHFPKQATITTMDATAVRILRGYPLHPDNIKSNLYMDFRGTTTAFADPWDHDYKVALDDDLDNQVTVNGENLFLSVAVWSAGPDGVSPSQDDVVSWAK